MILLGHACYYVKQAMEIGDKINLQAFCESVYRVTSEIQILQLDCMLGFYCNSEIFFTDG